MSEFIAEAQVLIVPNTAAFAATLKAQVEAAVLAAGPVAIPVEAVAVSSGAAAAAQAEVAAATKVGTTAAKEQAVALNEEAVAHERAGVAAVTDAAAQRKSTLARSQATRAIEAQAASLVGVRGAVLTASTPFLIATAAAIVFAKSVGEASDEIEQLNKVAVVFGDSAKQIEEFSQTTARSIGISETEALKAAGIFGNLFRTIRIGQKDSADMSEQLVKLAADLASFNNADPTRTLEALRSGLVGQARPLRVFGIFLSAARVNQQALIETGKKSSQELTDAEKVQARYTLVLRDSVLAQGDFARTSDRLANSSRILKAEISDLGASLGIVLIPALTKIVTASARTVDSLNKTVQIAKQLGQAVGPALATPFDTSSHSVENFEKKSAGLLAHFLSLSPVLAGVEIKQRALGESMDASAASASGLAPVLESAAKATTDLSNALFAAQTKTFAPSIRIFGAMSAAVLGLGAALRKAEFGIFQRASARAQADLLKLQTTGGTPEQQIAAIKRDEQAQRAAIDAAQRGGGSGAATRIKKAREALKADQSEIKSLQDGIIADRNKAAQDAKDAAAKAKAAQDRQDQALLDLFQGQQTKITDALISAGPQRELALTIKLRNLFRQQREETRKRIKDLQTRKSTLADETTQIKELNKQIKQLRKDQANALAEQAQARTDAQQAHLEALLSIAETTKSTADDKRAEKALIAFDQIQIRRILAIKRRRKLTLDEAAQLDAYRVDLAQRNAALKKTTEEQKKASFGQFQFAQALQGFAANLLGNLIPGFATGGLVGGSQAAAAQDAGLRQVAGGFEQPRGAVQGQAALASSRDRGVRPVQVDTTNHLLRQILRSLQNLNGRTQHPEARHNRAVGSALLDTMGGVHGA